MGFPEPDTESIVCFSTRIALRCILFSIFVIQFSFAMAADDDYLSAIEMETEKVERSALNAETQGEGASGVNGAGGGGDGFSSGLSIAGFEQELQDKYTGSSVFYKKLPRRSQEAIYQEYFEGASYSQLQKKIMDRYLGR